MCEQVAWSCYPTVEQLGVEPATCSVDESSALPGNSFFLKWKPESKIGHEWMELE